MKLYQIILLLLCFSLVLNCSSHSSDASKDVCNKDLTEEEKAKGYTHCCYIRYKLEKQDERKGCEIYNKYRFDHIKDFLKQMYFEAGTDDFNIECSSSYVKFGLLSLILILL